MAGRQAGMGEGSGQLLATLQTMAASLARIEAALDRAEAGRGRQVSGGIDHDDAKALRRMAEAGAEYADGEARAWRDARKADAPCTDQTAPTVDRTGESAADLRPWWLKPW